MGFVNHKKVIVAPLNWGLGHATRCVPIVHALIENKAEVILASDGNALAFLEKEFPLLKKIRLPDSNIKYYRFLPAWLSIILQFPKFIYQLRCDKIFIEKYLQKNQVDVILSDNRYGFRSKKVKSILITHQLQIISGFFGCIPNFIIQKLVSKFNYCLIPDFEPYEESLAGKLSHPSKITNQIFYIQALSRFTFNNQAPISSLIPVIISGPNPMKLKILNKLIEVLANTKDHFIIISGDATKQESRQIGNIKIVSHLETAQFEKIISESRYIISTGGYSSLMDFYRLNKKIIFIPFPGQTEQLYLSKFHSKSSHFKFIKYSKINQLPTLISSLETTNFKKTDDFEPFSSENLCQLIFRNN